MRVDSRASNHATRNELGNATGRSVNRLMMSAKGTGMGNPVGGAFIPVCLRRSHNIQTTEHNRHGHTHMRPTSLTRAKRASAALAQAEGA
jgi:hypothetical protein